MLGERTGLLALESTRFHDWTELDLLVQAQKLVLL